MTIIDPNFEQYLQDQQYRQTFNTDSEKSTFNHASAESAIKSEIMTSEPSRTIQSVSRPQKASQHPDFPRPYECSVCGRRFILAHHLSSHELIHTGLKPHVCNWCEAKFTQVSSLKRHERTIHRLILQGSASVSDTQSEFKRTAPVQVERRPVKCRQNICNLCGNSFSTKFSLSRHQLVCPGVDLARSANIQKESMDTQAPNCDTLDHNMTNGLDLRESKAERSDIILNQGNLSFDQLKYSNSTSGYDDKILINSPNQCNEETYDYSITSRLNVSQDLSPDELRNGYDNTCMSSENDLFEIDSLVVNTLKNNIMKNQENSSKNSCELNAVQISTSHSNSSVVNASQINGTVVNAAEDNCTVTNAALNNCSVAHTVRNNFSVENAASNNCSVVSTTGNNSSVANPASNSCYVVNPAYSNYGVVNTQPNNCTVINAAQNNCNGFNAAHFNINNGSSTSESLPSETNYNNPAPNQPIQSNIGATLGPSDSEFLSNIQDILLKNLEKSNKIAEELVKTVKTKRDSVNTEGSMDRPFKCNECHWSFRLHHHLVNHVTTHSRARPYTCYACRHPFSQISSLKRHVDHYCPASAASDDPGRFGCNMCDQKFLSTRAVKLHIKYHHCSSDTSENNS